LSSFWSGSEFNTLGLASFGVAIETISRLFALRGRRTSDVQFIPIPQSSICYYAYVLLQKGASENIC